MEHLWRNLDDYFMEFEKERKMDVMGVNARVECDEIDEIVGEWEVPGVNENESYIVDVCAERGLILVNTFFQHCS